MKNIFFTSLLIIFTTLPLSAQTNGALIPDFRVNDDLTNYTQEGPSIGVDGQGNFVIVWTDRRNTPSFPLRNYCQRFAFDGTRLGINFSIGQDTSGGGRITVLSNGKFIVTWQGKVDGKEDIYVQRFFADGSINGNPVKVNDTNVIGAIASLGDIDADSLGNFIIVWNDYRGGVAWEADVYGQRFDSAGNRIGSNFRINDNINQSSQSGPRIAVNKVGSFVICWNDTRAITAADIYMQRYDRYGSPIGVNQRVDDDTDNSRQGVCDIASDGKGHFVIAFDDFRDVYNTTHVYYQVYDTLGNKMGLNRKADENIGSTSAGATKVSMQENGKFVIMWSDERYNNFIQFAQRFNKDGTKIGVNFRIPELNSLINYGSEDIFLFSDRIYTVWNDTRNGNYDIFANVKSFINPDSILAGIGNENQFVKEFNLFPPYPNPFNPLSKIKFDIPKEIHVNIKVYDILGREVATLVNEFKKAGYYEMTFDGTNFASGVYFYRIEAGTFVDTKKMVLIK